MACSIQYSEQVCLSVEFHRSLRMIFLQSCDEGSKFIRFIGSIELKNMEVKQLCKKVSSAIFHFFST